MPAPWKGGWGRIRGPRGGWWRTAPPVAPIAPVDPAVYTARAIELLKEVRKGEPYVYPGGTRIPLLKDNMVIGELWADIDLSKASVGWVRPCRWGIVADILYEGRVVGLLYIEGYPPGWSWGPGRGYGRGWWSWGW